ncbi:hypothetical protein LBYS11_18680 [Lysinibacillus sp. YS11]|uniref:hypothetical protein n=1 Tax=unclassified Lysinibacillus TaxID=2636778 RepID=UPI000CA12B4C|nr:hypothetical protein LBYS11_18680 [Lysinibacillus sp. YS11]
MGLNAIGNFESALILFIDERIDVLYHNKVFRNHQNKMVKDVKQKLSKALSGISEKEVKEISESIQISILNYQHLLFQDIYKQGFLDGIVLREKIPGGSINDESTF